MRAFPSIGVRWTTVIALVIGSLGAAPGGASGASPTGALNAVEPCRLVDTRLSGPGSPEPPRPSDEVVPTVIAGRCGVPDDAVAVALQVAVTRTVGVGHVAVLPAGTDDVTTSTVNWSGDDRAVAGGTIVGVGRGGSVDVHVVGTTHVIVDVNAYFAPATEARGGRFATIDPQRVVDTRAGDPWLPGESRLVPLPEAVPADALAIVANVTTVRSRGRGFLTVHAAGTRRPLASILNTDAAGQTRASAAIVPVSPDGFVLHSSAGGHLLVDVFGFFTGPSATISADGLFRPVDPVRVFDSRAPGTDVFHDGGSQPISTAAVGPVAAVAGVVTLARTSAATHVTVFPAASSLPPTSNVNADGPGQAVANLFVVPVSSQGMAVRAHRETHVIVDVTGAFSGRPIPPSEHPYPLSNVDPGPSCHGTSGRAAIVDRVAQRMWLCRDGTAVSGEMPFTAGPINDAPRGEYHVFFKRDPWWGAGYTLRWFTAFTRGDQGGRVAFHRYVAMREQDIGTEAYRNASHGCFRLRTADAALVWNFLLWGDTVLVLNDG